MNLSENNTSNITYGILDLISLKYIDLSKNKIGYFSPLLDLPEIKIIRLSNNNITNLPLEKLLGIKKTIKIDLTGNNIPQEYLDKLRNHPYIKIVHENLK